MQPFVLRGYLQEKQWPPIKLWTKKYIRDNFAKKAGSVFARLGSREHVNGKILHDHESIHYQFESFSEMLDWMSGLHDKSNLPCSSNNLNINSQTHWAYFDYHDILELLDEENAIIADWGKLDIFPFELNKNLEDNENWKGTSGAYTPCHYDTYGFNLHAQLFGYKRWLLFPPGTDLRPTRLPYEESSVFSSFDIIGATMKSEYGKQENIPFPYVVVCGPGDLLFIPQKWWHSVQCISKINEENEQLCFSINKWFPTENDQLESKKEALLKFMISLNLNVGLLDISNDICLTEKDSLNNKNNLEELAILVNERLNDEEKNDDLINKINIYTTKRIKLNENIKFNEEYFYSKFLNNSLREEILIKKWEEIQKTEKGF
ncbi:JmjC domain-containing protein [Meloidogyne graminicola]|uniref:JmjC domain-containing protein n=1 Tax=Meloidogyne graminicola TaxID=189291 RepID=A0A8S9ZUX8_9BILA|nr:JmjC domain-containing protein [Meloidogyne graminicola]